MGQGPALSKARGMAEAGGSERPRACRRTHRRAGVRAPGWLTPAVISFPAREQWLKNKCGRPLSRLLVRSTLASPAERMESLGPAPSGTLRPAQRAGQPSPGPRPLRARPDGPAGTFSLPFQVPGPALGQQPGESPRDEDATAQWDALSALAAPSAQRPEARPSLTPCRLPSRTGIYE